MSREHELHGFAEAVDDLHSFLKFLRALGQRAERSGEEGDLRHGDKVWQHASIEAYLDAAVAWTEDQLKHGPRGRAVARAGEDWTYPLDGSPWRQCAKILLAGALYE